VEPEVVKEIPITTASDEARDDFLKGRDLWERLLAQESYGHFQNAVVKDPDFAVAYVYLALSSPSNKEFFENLGKGVALADQVSEGERLWILGFQAGIDGDLAKREELCEKLVELYPEDARAHDNLANHYTAKQEYGSAIQEYQKAIELDPQYSPAYNSMGYAHRSLGQFEEAEKAFKQYIDLIPDDPNPLDSYAELLMKMGRFEESIEAYEKALAIDPQFPGSHLGIAANLMFQEKHEDAIARLEEYHAQARDDGERRQADYAMAVIFVDGGDFESGLEQIGRASAQAETNGDKGSMAFDAVARGNLFCEMGQADEAAAEFERSIALVRESNVSDGAKKLAEIGLHRNLARVVLLKGELDAAKEEAGKFRAGVEDLGNPNQIRQAHELAGIIALREKDYDTALAELQQANQESPYVLYQIGLAHEGKGDNDQAMEFFERTASHNTLPTLRYAVVRKQAQEKLGTS
jgi:tetratricopeptide (TPR) repeat protein